MQQTDALVSQASSLIACCPEGGKSSSSHSEFTQLAMHWTPPDTCVTRTGRKSLCPCSELIRYNGWQGGWIPTALLRVMLRAANPGTWTCPILKPSLYIVTDRGIKMSKRGLHSNHPCKRPPIGLQPNCKAVLLVTAQDISILEEIILSVTSQVLTLHVIMTHFVFPHYWNPWKISFDAIN